jgi:hypothetical protein
MHGPQISPRIDDAYDSSDLPLPLGPARRCAFMLAAAAILVAPPAGIASAGDAMTGNPTANAVQQDPPNNPPTAIRQGDGAVHVQPNARQFAWPNRPDVDPARAKEVDELYRELMGLRMPIEQASVP